MFVPAVNPLHAVTPEDSAYKEAPARAQDLALGRKAGVSVLRGQPALEHLPGLTVQPARHHRSCVHIQFNSPSGVVVTATTTSTIVNSQLSTNVC